MIYFATCCAIASLFDFLTDRKGFASWKTRNITTKQDLLKMAKSYNNLLKNSPADLQKIRWCYNAEVVELANSIRN
jgi:hypothetical protein